jgi:hypothetical protein
MFYHSLFDMNHNHNFYKILSYYISMCPIRDSNSYTFRHQILSLACLPISPTGRLLVRMDSNHHEDFSHRTLLALWSTHYSTFISYSPPPRQEGLSANFNTYQNAEVQGFEPQIRFHVTVFKTVPFNHSGKLPLELKNFIVFIFNSFSCFICFFVHSHPCQKYINRCQCPAH